MLHSTLYRLILANNPHTRILHKEDIDERSWCRSHFVEFEMGLYRSHNIHSFWTDRDSYKYWCKDVAPEKNGLTGNAIWDAMHLIFGTNGLFELRKNVSDNVHPLAQMVGIGRSLGESSIRNVMGAIGSSVLGGLAGAVNQNIGGSLNADEISDADFAGAAIGTAAAGMFTASKLGPIFAGSTIPKVATFGAALGSLPVLI